MNAKSIDQMLDDAVQLMALGADAEHCAERWPAQQHELLPLLHVAQTLRACAQESDNLLAGHTHGAIDWTALLNDVPQDGKKRVQHLS